MVVGVAQPSEGDSSAATTAPLTRGIKTHFRPISSTPRVDRWSCRHRVRHGRHPANDVFLSAVSAWEIAVKHALGKLPLPDPPSRYVPKQRASRGIAPLPLDEDAALHLSLLPELHRDPFDRMLICQALAAGMLIVTPDPEIARYPVRTLW